MALAAVMTQTLLPKVGGGLVPAAELLMVSYGARQHIRKNALQHMHQEMTITRKLGSFTLEESLAQLVKQGLVDRPTRSRAPRTSRSWSNCSAEQCSTARHGRCYRMSPTVRVCRVTFRRRQLMQMFRRILCDHARGDAVRTRRVGAADPCHQQVRARPGGPAARQPGSGGSRGASQLPAESAGEERRGQGRPVGREGRSGRVDAAGRRAASGRGPGARREPGSRGWCDGRHHDDDDHHHPAGRHPDHRRWSTSERAGLGRRAVRGGLSRLVRARAALPAASAARLSRRSLSSADRSAVRRRRGRDGDALLGRAGHLRRRVRAARGSFGRRHPHVRARRRARERALDGRRRSGRRGAAARGAGRAAVR